MRLCKPMKLDAETHTSNYHIIPYIYIYVSFPYNQIKAKSPRKRAFGFNHILVLQFYLLINRVYYLFGRRFLSLPPRLFLSRPPLGRGLVSGSLPPSSKH